MEIVGEITDEHDTYTGNGLLPDGDNIWIMDGDVHLDEVQRAIGYDLPETEVETVAGLLIAELGALPSQGDTVTVDLPIDPAELVSDQPMRRRLEVDVLRVERHIPTQVRVRLVEVLMTEDDQ